MPPKTLLPPNDETRMTAVGPIPQYSAKELLELGVVARYGGNKLYYTRERAERHAIARTAMAVMYSQGAFIINQGLANEPFSLKSITFDDSTAANLPEMTSEQLRVAKQYQCAFRCIPELKQAISNRGRVKDLLKIAFIAKVAFNHINVEEFGALFDELGQGSGQLTLDPSNNFDLPNGSTVPEHFPLVLMALQIYANKANYTKEQVQKAEDCLLPTLTGPLFTELLIALGYSPEEIDESSTPFKKRKFPAIAQQCVLNLYNNENNALTLVESLPNTPKITNAEEKTLPKEKTVRPESSETPPKTTPEVTKKSEEVTLKQHVLPVLPGMLKLRYPADYDGALSTYNLMLNGLSKRELPLPVQASNQFQALRDMAVGFHTEDPSNDPLLIKSLHHTSQLMHGEITSERYLAIAHQIKQDNKAAAKYKCHGKISALMVGLGLLLVAAGILTFGVASAAGLGLVSIGAISTGAATAAGSAVVGADSFRLFKSAKATQERLGEEMEKVEKHVPSGTKKF